jgi:Ca-activated chloride channel family protein
LFNNIDKEYQLGASIAMFGMKLRQSKYFPLADWTETERIATNAYNPDNYLQKQYLQLIGMAKKIYVKKRMKFKD